MYLTQQFARFIADTCFDDLPEQVVYQAKERIMDALGAALAGSRNWEYSEKLKEACKSLGSGCCGVIGGGERVYSPAHGAMISATFAHAVELDDGHRNAGCHAGAVVVPTAMVLGQAMGKTGKEVITAVALGYEVIYRIASHVNPKQINKGFHPSSNCGAYGAAAVAGKLMGLDGEQLANALGQAGMLASGTMEATKSGQRSKCVQVGNAAYNGVLAALLAQTGMEGCLSALEGPNGLFATQSEDVDMEDVCRGLGRVWSIGDTYNKLYPSCRHAQPGIEAAMDLSAEHHIRPEEVEQVWIGTHQVAYDLTGAIKAPKNAGEAKFSLAYGTAVALREHCFGVVHLTEPSYTDAGTLALAQRVSVAVDPDVQAIYPRKRGARVKITLKDGMVYEKELYDLKGSPNNPVGWGELSVKFAANAGAMLDSETVSFLLEELARLEELDSVAPIMERIE